MQRPEPLDVAFGVLAGQVQPAPVVVVGQELCELHPGIVIEVAVERRELPRPPTVGQQLAGRPAPARRTDQLAVEERQQDRLAARRAAQVVGAHQERELNVHDLQPGGVVQADAPSAEPLIAAACTLNVTWMSRPPTRR